MTERTASRQETGAAVEATPERPPEAAPGPWFGPREVPENHMIQGRVGPLRLWLAHRPGDWRLATLEEAEDTPEAFVGAPEAIVEPPPEAQICRFATDLPGDDVALRPALADRPVVARPELPLTIPGHDAVVLYVATPLWLALELLAPDRFLISLPTHRPSDTFFGPNTRHGEVAYATRTAARRHLDNVELDPHRAITRVRIVNHADDGLLLERLSIPAPSLGLWADRRHYLWTDPVTAERAASGAIGEIEISATPPPEAEDAERVAEPRSVTEPTLIRRALQVFLG